MNMHSIPTGDNRGLNVSYGALHHEKKTQRYTRKLDFHVHNLFVSEKMRCKCDIFFLLSTSLQSVQCSREPPYFIAPNNFTSHELTAWTGRGTSKKELWKIWIGSGEKGKKSPWECRVLTVIKHSRLRCGLHTITTIKAGC